MLVGGWFGRSRTREAHKNVPFESGIDSVGTARLRLSASQVFTCSHVLAIRRAVSVRMVDFYPRKRLLALWKLQFFILCYWLVWFILARIGALD